MNRFPGVGRRIRQRLKATGYWKDGRPDIARFCTDKDYRSQYLYAWLGDRVPTYENLVRLAHDDHQYSRSERSRNRLLQVHAHRHRQRR